MRASPLQDGSLGSAASPADAELMSAWIDGELDAAQAQALLDRLKVDAALRDRFEAMHQVGDALLSHELAACHCPALVHKVSLALRDEPALLAPRALLPRGVGRHLATGLTLAAAAAVLAVVALPQLRGAPAGQPALTEQAAMATTGGAQPASQRAAPAPQLASPSMAAVATVAASRTSPQLDAYFRAHRELAAQGVMPEAAAYIRSGGEQDR
jgi:negative regulator of sigma E activity